MNVLYLALHQEFPAPHAGYTHVLNICTSLKELGHRVVLVSRPPSKGVDDGEAPAPGMQTGAARLDVRYVSWGLDYPVPDLVKLPSQVLQQASGELPRAVSAIKRLAREEDVDVIHERHDMKMDVGQVAGRKLGLPRVLEVNSPFLEEFHREGSVKFNALNSFRKQGFDSASAIITQTPILAGMIGQHTETPIEVIPNGADPGHFTPDVDAAGLKERLGLGDRRGVGFSGAFKPWHGVVSLVRAFTSVREACPDAALLLIGGGERRDMDEVKGLVGELGLAGDVVFTGPVGYADMPAYLASCDVLAAPFDPGADRKRREVFEKYGLWWSPLKVFEYMAMARPVVSPSLGMLPEYIEGAGLTYEEGNTEGLAARLVDLLCDTEEAARLGARGREKVISDYSWRRAAERTVEVYERIAGVGH